MLKLKLNDTFMDENNKSYIELFNDVKAMMKTINKLKHNFGYRCI